MLPIHSNFWKIDEFPHATIAEYGTYHHNVEAIKAEIYARGPVAAGINGTYLHSYTGGIIRDEESLRNLHMSHIVSIVGWGIDKTSNSSGKVDSSIPYWIVRNSHGEYWGELSFFRIEMGTNLLGIETKIAWATPGSFTIHNVPCFPDGSNCKRGNAHEMKYLDPSILEAYGRRVLSLL